jgi:hypothetical protein
MKRNTITITIIAGVAASVAHADPVIWDNTFTHDSALLSQTDTTYPFDAQLADDFIFSQPHYITDVHWWGEVLGGNPVDPLQFNLLSVWTVEDSADFDPIMGADKYEVDVDPVFLAANEKYWIAIQANLQMPAEWGWSVSDSGQLTGAKYGYPLQGFPYWSDAPGAFDANWVLTGQLVPAPGAASLLALATFAFHRAQRRC